MKSNESEYELKCVQHTSENLEDYSSKASFFLEFYKNKKQIKTIGNLKRFRKGVVQYDIERVLTGPEGKFVVVIVRKKMLGFEGPSIRWMVETMKLY